MAFEVSSGVRKRWESANCPRFGCSLHEILLAIDGMRAACHDVSVAMRTLTSRFARWAVFAVPLILAQCTQIPELGALADQGGTSHRRIVVSLGEQKARLYHRGKLVAESPISSGREGKRSPVGRFSVVEKDVDHRSSLYGNYVRNGKVVKENIDVRKGGRPAGSKFEGVPMPYFLRFSGAFGLHAGRLPGYPASSGCIRLPKRQAKRFYDAVRVGTPVIVQR